MVTSSTSQRSHRVAVVTGLPGRPGSGVDVFAMFILAFWIATGAPSIDGTGKWRRTPPVGRRRTPLRTGGRFGPCALGVETVAVRADPGQPQPAWISTTVVRLNDACMNHAMPRRPVRRVITAAISPNRNSPGITTHSR